MRRSIFFRLLGVTVLVSVCSIAATTWLVASLTRASIQQEQGRDLAVDNTIYTALLDYAVKNPTWDDVDYLVDDLAEQHPNRRIALLTEDRRAIFDSDPGGPLPATPAAVIDPLALDPVLVRDAPADRIDRRVLGPFRSPVDQREPEDRTDTLNCLRLNKIARKADPTAELKECFDVRMPADTAADYQALMDLEDLVNSCLARRELPPVELDPDFTPARKQSNGQEVPDKPAVAACVVTARQEQLAPYVPPPALLMVTTPASAPTTSLDFSSANGWKIALLAGAVVLVAVGVTAVACSRLIRPLRALTTAANRMAGGDATTHVPVRGRDEISQLTAAFNTMAGNRERLEQLRKAMVGDIAHELRTPLSNIRGWLEAAEDGLSARDATLTALLLKEALVLQHVVDDLQDLSTADAGALRLNRQPVPVAAMFAQLCSAHVARAERDGIELSASAPEDLRVNADPVRLRQMLDNLVTNALRHVPRGGSVTVAAYPDGGDVVIDVVDTGPGIGAEDLPHVFDRFWRAEKSRSRQTGGSGLGLAIVRKLAETHGGTATATSTPGQGATFTLRLPEPATGGRPQRS